VPLSSRDDARGDAPARRRLVDEVPVAQSYFIPLGEGKLVQTFVTLSDGVGAPLEVECNATYCESIETFISITVNFNDTLILWDHFEDGYEDDEGTKTQPDTEIWGDGDCSNGFPPDLDPCVDSDDVLNEGRAIIISNIVKLPRNTSEIFYDGGDQVLASAPVKVTRGGFAVSATEKLAGAVEVYQEALWGLNHTVPIGGDSLDGPKGFDPFNTTSIYVMAAEDNTTVTYNGGSTVELTKGETFVIENAKQGDTVNADKPIQVHILTGEVGQPFYELRWYSLVEEDKWSNDYYSPVGIDDGGTRQTRVWVFNPNNETITVEFEGVNGTLGNDLVVPPGQAARTNFSIPTGSGVRAFSDDTFFALTQTDVALGDFTRNRGQREDWGHPMIPSKDLTAQALVGIGWGCPEQRVNGSVPCDELGTGPNGTIISEGKFRHMTCYATSFTLAICFLSPVFISMSSRMGNGNG
jgi:hypothetical protein